MNLAWALLVTIPSVLVAWGLLDKESPRTAKAFWDWWSRDGMMVFIAVLMLVLLWLGAHSGASMEDEMLTPEYP